ncbi:UNVERIFIED_CONTAM: TBC1 domain family member 13 [Sesamum radiatum]|uniref:TBC1 domain family member 13 n=1 Tax=Sesamum radiatum TaxID=300843 RepID=A0AAW2QG44_SESRA
MVKKRVPDWLNSSLWSSPQPPPSPPSKESVKSPASPIVEPPPPPEPVRASSGHATGAAKGGIRDPLSSNYGSNSSTCLSDEENRSSSANSTVSVGGVRSAPPAAEEISRQVQLLQELSRKVINMGELRRLASQGIPGAAGIRSTVWKLLLGYLPPDRSLWPSELAKKRSQYKHLKEELLMNPASAEADTFFCFVELISGFRDNFVQQLDNSVVGIRSTLTRLSQLLKEHDEELWRHLEMATKVNTQFYAFRWITLLLTQEFNFTDSLVIWDTLLSDPDGPQETLLRICCAMLIIVRKRLLAGDFTSNLKLLQHYPSTNISHLLYVANKLRIPSAG